MKHIIKVYITLCLIVLSGGVAAQGNDVWMQNGQTLQVNARQSRTGTIYDDGGPANNYSNNFNGRVVIDAGPFLTLTLSGSYATESCCDHITIWDGDENSGTQVFNGSGYSSLSLTSSTGKFTILFVTDGSVNSDGLAFSYLADGIDCNSTNCQNGVTAVTVTNVGSTTAEVSWTGGDGPWQWSLVRGYWAAGSIQSGTANTASVTLGGLNPNTVYSVGVTSGSDLSSCCYETVTFRTACGQMTAPLAELFDDYGTGSNVTPTCWTIHSNIDNDVVANVSGDAYVSGSASLRMFTTDAGYFSVALLPEIISPSLSSLTVRLKLRAPYSGTSLEIGVCEGSSLYSVANFTPVDTLTLSTANQWQEFLVPLSSYSGSGRYLALRMHGNLQEGINRTIYIDDLFVESCGVYNIGMVRRNASNIWLQWDTYGNPTVDLEIVGSGEWGVESGEQADSLSTLHSPLSTTLAGVTSPLQVSGLQHSTGYRFRLIPTCGGAISASSDGDGVYYSTLEGPRNDLNLCEDFETSADVPIGWRRNNLNDGTPQTSTYYHHGGGRALRLRPYYTETMPTVVLPMVDTVALSQLTVGFWAMSDGYTTGRIVVGVMEYPDEASSFVPVDTVTVESGVWREYRVMLGSGEWVVDGTGGQALSTPRYIALRAFDPTTSYNSIYLDDLELGTCLLSGALVTNIGSHSVELRWDTVDADFLGDSVIVEVENGELSTLHSPLTTLSFPVRGTEVETIGGKQKAIVTGLEADSAYTFRIYGQCGLPANGQSSVAGYVASCGATLTVRTLGQDITLPYCVDFEGMADGSYPAGWLRPAMYDSYPRIFVDGYPKHSGDRALYLRSYRELENHSTVVLPMFETDSLRGLAVSFHTWGETSDGQTVQVGVMDDPNDESTFTVVATVAASYGQWGHHVASLDGYTGNGRYIALRHYNNYFWSSAGLWIDDIVVGDAAAANQTAGGITSHSATISWDGVGRNYGGAVVEWGPAGFTRGSGNRDTVLLGSEEWTSGQVLPTTHYPLSTLLPGTTYDYFVTALSAGSADPLPCDFTRQSFTTFDHPTAASWCYGFEDNGDGGYPNGWTRP